MALKFTTSKDSVAMYFDKIFEIVAKQMKIHLQLLGEQCVNRIRKKHGNDWTDRTGNLRSSIGYAVFNEGKNVVQSQFETILQGSTGSAKGRAYIQTLAKEYANVYALVVVAGMDYASFVEAGSGNRKAKDVLASTSLWASNQIQKYLQQAFDIAGEEINRLKIN